ncbi:MAG: ATP-binding protein, partial [Planctomycetota bacterium]
GMCELLQTTELNPKQSDYINLATQSARNLLGLIDDILDFSKMEAGRLDIDEHPFSLTNLIDEVAGIMSVVAEEKGLQLIESRADNVGDAYIGDALRIRQIILNLLSNAIKFTSNGHVKLSVYRLDETVNNTKKRGSQVIGFEVEDTGKGIPGQLVDKLFEPFEQEDSSITRKHGGTGLGLAISKMLAEMMGGTIKAQSQVGKGSKFTFTASLMPTNIQSPARTPNQTTTSDFVPKRVLLAEDGAVNQKVAIGLLEKRGHQVDVVVNGYEALEALQKNSYDLVLMDIQMPEMDGLTAVKQIRRQEEVSGEKRQRVIAVTAHAMSGDKTRFLEAGMDGYIPKPFKADALYMAVEDTKLFDTDASSSSTEPNLPTLDKDVALQTTGGDVSLAQVLLETCLEESPKLVSQAKTAVVERRWTDAKRFGHSMKSSFGAVGAMAASKLSKQLESIDSEAEQPFTETLAAIEIELKKLVAHVENQN